MANRNPQQELARMLVAHLVHYPRLVLAIFWLRSCLAMVDRKGAAAVGKLGIVKEMWAYLRERKKWWLMPILVMLVLMAGLVLLTEGSAIAPFIYALF